ncbi:MAG TPA: type VI secretion system ATPase TssH [Pyrinomonadaceae bacterium]|nr:type VI secretion system ATPase TssH [Chloracidobacterium sp.]MBP9935488.1 type VI secretion system ATPase TssH [Pyrinomonadaceae bacterium]MBK7801897.1 type VI secretion system ATPase TssH [Chloracidobacterium sp.]MBK9437960.1 type VI secretion system ATPase TssH [Chloracidobacterium sp.]MBL0242202.1 type VI secretion system ATPase TssH [Chloracidobacterium sp.]
MNVNLKSLIGRLNDTCREALEGAAGLCLSRTNYDVEIEHILFKLLEQDNTDLHRICNHYEVSIDRLAKDVNEALGRLKTGNTRTPGLSDRLPRWIQDAWLLASVDFGAARVRSGHLVLALVANESYARIAREISREFNHISAESLQIKLPEITADSNEERDAVALGETAGSADGSPVASGVPGKTKALDQYTEDLTAKAAAGKIDPILGREGEIRQIIDILTRRRQNNPILTGEAGVGKTAVVEGFAARIAAGDVPDPLKNVSVRSLDLGLLQAGAGVKGEFEQRLKNVIDEVKSSPQPIIMFIDEAHTMIGAGGQAGQNDAANLLKPALARGELRTIAATTWAEYKKYFEKDAALARRFQVVKVDEPDEEKAVAMMRGLTGKMEEHHNVRILDEAIVECVKLSSRYITGRQLPDKSVSVLDTACAKVAIGQGATPAAVEDETRLIQNLSSESEALEREQVTGADHGTRLAELKTALDTSTAELAKLNGQWTKEKELVEKIRNIRAKLEMSRLDPEPVETAAIEGEAVAVDAETTTPEPAVDVDLLRAELKSANEELKTIQGENPLMQPVVNGQTVAEVISGWTGIPIGKMVADEINAVLKLAATLQERVLGQNHALEAIAQRIRTSRAGLTDPKRPIGVFMLVGTSGVGKTETALALADSLYGGERNLISINMSEYQEAHTVSSLKGSPPGYVGYGEGGVLTEAVRRKPYSVVLLDEVEKAHPDVMELFFQVFDKGVLEDGEGREIDFKNCIIILTSNVGTDTIMKLCADPDTTPSPEGLVDAIKPELNKAFKPALLGRMVTVPFYPISDEIMRLIIKLQLGKIAKRIKDNHNAQFSYDDTVIETVAKRCTDVDSGARNVYNILTGTLLPEMSGEVLARMASGEGISKVHVGVGEGENFTYQFE